MRWWLPQAEPAFSGSDPTRKPQTSATQSDLTPAPRMNGSATSHALQSSRADPIILQASGEWEGSQGECEPVNCAAGVTLHAGLPSHQGPATQENEPSPLMLPRRAGSSGEIKTAPCNLQREELWGGETSGDEPGEFGQFADGANTGPQVMAVSDGLSSEVVFGGVPSYPENETRPTDPGAGPFAAIVSRMAGKPAARFPSGTLE